MKIEEIPEPGSPEWEKLVEHEARRKQFYQEVDLRCEQILRGNRSSSWERIDLHDEAYGTHDELKPQWMRREDRAKLLYPGCTHSLHGATGSGKTWALLLAMAQVLKETDKHVLYLDYESFPAQIVRRLLLLGVMPHVIEEQLHYYRPRHRPDVLDIDKNAFAHLLSFDKGYAIAGIDGANICMGLAGLNPNNAEDVATWHEMILNPKRSEPVRQPSPTITFPKNRICPVSLSEANTRSLV